MKVLHFAEFASGGVATFLRNTINYQLESEEIDEVILVNSRIKSEQFNFKNEKFKNLKYEYNRNIHGIRKILTLRKYIDKYKPDVVHIHSSFAGLIRMTYFLKRPKYKVVYCAHGWSFIQQNKSKFIKNIYALIEKILARKTDLIINISDNENGIATEYGMPITKMRIIYNSVPLNNINNIEKNNNLLGNNNSKNKKLLFIGRFDEAKGLNFLLENLDFRLNDLDLFIIGESVLGDNQSMVKKENVNFLGWIDNAKIDQYIKCADAVIVPSLWEGFGLVALEAMKNRKMVISSDAGGLPELIDDGVNGLLFKSGSQESLEQIITRFKGLSDDKIVEMGLLGFDKYLKKYNFDKLNKELVKYYLDLKGECHG